MLLFVLVICEFLGTSFDVVTMFSKDHMLIVDINCQSFDAFLKEHLVYFFPSVGFCQKIRTQTFNIRLFT